MFVKMEEKKDFKDSSKERKTLQESEHEFRPG